MVWQIFPNSKHRWLHVGPMWILSAPRWANVGPTCLAIWVYLIAAIDCCDIWDVTKWGNQLGTFSFPPEALIGVWRYFYFGFISGSKHIISSGYRSIGIWGNIMAFWCDDSVPKDMLGKSSQLLWICFLPWKSLYFCRNNILILKIAASNAWLFFKNKP